MLGLGVERARLPAVVTLGDLRACKAAGRSPKRASGSHPLEIGENAALAVLHA